MSVSDRPKDRTGFTIAIMCALGRESDAVEAAFDEIWNSKAFGKADQDLNTYTTGRIGSENVVLSYMPRMGKAASSSVTTSFRHSFPRIKLALLVGVCGAVPITNKGEEIVLGDVIISNSVKEVDFGRKVATGLQTKETLYDIFWRSTPEVRGFLQKLEGWYSRTLLQDETRKNLDILCKKQDFQSHHYPGAGLDKLFPPQYLHKHGTRSTPTPQDQMCKCFENNVAVCDQALKSSCAEIRCDENELISRSRLQLGTNPQPVIYFGKIASSDQVVRDAVYRDQLASDNGILAFEMEGAGAWDNIPTVIIKGVCDYADTHKNKIFQDYAAAVAASCMKAFLDQWVSSDTRKQPRRTWANSWRAFILMGIIVVTFAALVQSMQNSLQLVGVDRNAPIFAVIGKTGVGKSSFIKVLGGRNSSNFAPKVCDGLETCTNEILIYKTLVDNSPVYLMDTPGFDDTRMTDHEVINMISSKLDDLYHDGRPVRGLIYLYDINAIRVGGLAAKQFMAFERILGLDRFQNLVFVTSKWPRNPAGNEVPRELLDREAQLKEKYWKKMTDRGAEARQHDGTERSASLIIMSLMYKPNFRPTQDYYEKLQTLYNEPSPAGEANHDNEPSPIGETNHDNEQCRSRSLKLLWTLFRSYSAFISLLFSLLSVLDYRRVPPSARIFASWECLVLVAKMAGLYYRPDYLSLGSIIHFCGGFIIIMFTRETKDTAQPLSIAIALPTVIMTFVYLGCLPHTSQMYYF